MEHTTFNCMFFVNRFLVCFNLFVLLFLVIPCLVRAVQPCMEWSPIKKNIPLIWCNIVSTGWSDQALKILHSGLNRFINSFEFVFFKKVFVTSITFSRFHAFFHLLTRFFLLVYFVSIWHRKVQNRFNIRRITTLIFCLMPRKNTWCRYVNHYL